MVHASAIEYRGKALVFLGPSGTGKSTISELLARTLDGARVLADDRIDLHWQTDNRWMVTDATRFLSDAPGAQTAPDSAHVQLGAIFRLYQAMSPRLEPVSMLDTCFHLVKAFAEAGSGQAESIEEKKACLASLAAMARITPGYAFYCDRSDQTTHVLQQEVAYE